VRTIPEFLECEVLQQEHCINPLTFTFTLCFAYLLSVCAQVVAGVCHSVVYGLMSFVLDQFHVETLGSDTQV